ncbi:Hint domain-containing protein [Shimia thalassica]|uniref:Hint domain-containing protein n=1 Tax=Shimia thalassica TaxID=1715693 RepID=UPI0024957F73|nr:Hint domain-containing protein [Shimia thalassica]
MATISFFARGDSNTANNAALNAENTNTTPTTEITFSSGASGNLLLEPNGGNTDPDTTVIVNGVEMSFTVNFSGTLPFTNKLSNVNGLDLRGEPIVVITTVAGQRLFFLTNGITEVTMDDFPNGAHDLEMVTDTVVVPVCFVKGARIRTPSGDTPVENLKVGDLVTCADGGSQEILWMSQRDFSFQELLIHPEFRPICIAADLFGVGVPAADLWLSPQHRVMFSGWEAELYFQNPEVFLPAVSLSAGREGTGSDIANGVTYFHMMFAQHEVIFANDLPCESLFPGDSALASLTQSARDSLAARFDQHKNNWSDYGPTARHALSRREGEILLECAGIGRGAQFVPEPHQLLAA